MKYVPAVRPSDDLFGELVENTSAAWQWICSTSADMNMYWAGRTTVVPSGGAWHKFQCSSA